MCPKERLATHYNADGLCNAPSLWPKVLRFVNKVSYGNTKDFENAYAICVDNVKDFYRCGSTTFLTKITQVISKISTVMY